MSCSLADNGNRVVKMGVLPVRVGLVSGLFFAFWQFLWSFLVAIGLAQPLLDVMAWAQFFDLSPAIQPFQFQRAMFLITLWLLGGFFVGIVAGLSWNALHTVTEHEEEWRPLSR